VCCVPSGDDGDPSHDRHVLQGFSGSKTGAFGHAGKYGDDGSVQPVPGEPSLRGPDQARKGLTVIETRCGRLML